MGEELAVLDKSLGKLIKEKLEIDVINKCVKHLSYDALLHADVLLELKHSSFYHSICLHTMLDSSQRLMSYSSSIMELARGIRSQLAGLIR